MIRYHGVILEETMTIELWRCSDFPDKYYTGQVYGNNDSHALHKIQELFPQYRIVML
jgi:hypothetical protein